MLRIAQAVAYLVLVYGLVTVATTLIRQIHPAERHTADISFSVPLLVALSYVYLGTLLLRRKYNAWLAGLAVSALSLFFSLLHILTHLQGGEYVASAYVHAVFGIIIIGALAASRKTFQVKSDATSFLQAVRTSIVILTVALLYGVGGFLLLDRHDFHQEIGIYTAIDQTVDQFGLTNKSVVPHTRRAHVFVNSLSVVSVGAAVYVVISFFQPIRSRFVSHAGQRLEVERLLKEFPSDIDDFFKLWPHDKTYFLNPSHTAGLAYKTVRGVALVVGNPFGNPAEFKDLLRKFEELCFVNDWLPSFVHISDTQRKLYESFGYNLQKMGEEAVLDIGSFESNKRSKYFRHITNKFTKLGYRVDIIDAPHDVTLLARLKIISDQWLTKPGRSEYGFMLGSFGDAYMQASRLALLIDSDGQVKGFMNLIPTYTESTANYDLLRCSDEAPGNAADFLLLGVSEKLVAEGTTTLNLGLSLLTNIDTEPEQKGSVNAALKFLHDNGGRFYNFAGLRRFKDKYDPDWQPRYIAYKGGVATFARVVAALNKAVKV